MIYIEKFKNYFNILYFPIYPTYIPNIIYYL